MAAVTARPERVSELFECLFSGDEIVRMRAADALEKVCRENPDIVAPFGDRLIEEISKINQPSVQWHLAEILRQIPLTNKQRLDAVKLMKRNLAESTDWIVLNQSVETLASFAKDDPTLKQYLVPILESYRSGQYKSLAARARRLLKSLSKSNPNGRFSNDARSQVQRASVQRGGRT